MNTATLGRGTVRGEISRVRRGSKWRRPERRHTYKHRGFGRSAQPQVLEPVLLVLALLRELFHPGLAGLQRVSRRGGQAAQQAHGPAPLWGLQGAACISPSAEERPSMAAWSSLAWPGNRPLKTDLSGRFTRRLARPEIL